MYLMERIVIRQRNVFGAMVMCGVVLAGRGGGGSSTGSASSPLRRHDDKLHVGWLDCRLSGRDRAC